MDHGISYIKLLAILKNFPGISFQNQPGLRSLGFWLWEQIHLLRNFNTVVDAIKFLRSGEDFPVDLLSRIGLDYAEPRKYNRLCQRTRECIQAGEVLALANKLTLCRTEYCF